MTAIAIKWIVASVIVALCVSIIVGLILSCIRLIIKMRVEDKEFKEALREIAADMANADINK